MIEIKNKPSDFSLTLMQMCSFAVIAKVGDIDETLGQLVLHFLAVRPDEKNWDTRQLAEQLDSLFRLQLPEYQIQKSLNWLVSKGYIYQLANNFFTLSAHHQERLQKQIDEARKLENKVKQEWLNEVAMKFPTLPLSQSWEALQAYIAKAFLSHGIQSVALLNPQINIAHEYAESLSLIMTDVLKEIFALELHDAARDAISNFFVTVGSHPDRAKYFTQLGDGAFNYFSLMVAPNIASQFRKKLSQVTMFLDTNFLLGILDLHVNPFIEVSKELLRITTQKFRTTEKLCFELRYHQATEQELRSTIAYYSASIRAQACSQKASQAIINSPEFANVKSHLSGIELRYHQLNAEIGIDANSFLKLFEHVDVLLREKGIHIYKTQTDNDIDEILHEYEDFLGTKKKPYKLLKHDITVLNAVRKMRALSNSSLEVGAMFITCDYNLYKFDLQNKQIQSDMASVVLPHHFLQVLRPFITTDTDFDRSFAATFAIPEFRSMNSEASKACSESLSLVASYKFSSLSEDTAQEIIAKSLLNDGLRTIREDPRFQEAIEPTILAEHALLLEETAALATQLKQELDEYAIEKSKTKQILQQKDEELERFKMKSIELEKKKPKVEHFEKLRAIEKKKVEQARRKAEIEKKARENAETRVAKAERTTNFYKMAVAYLISSILIGTFELCTYWLHWQWLIENRNSYGLQVIFDLMLAFLVFSIFLPKWRKWFLSTEGIFVILLVLSELLGGANK